jgi:hypothetical protein
MLVIACRASDANLDGSSCRCGPVDLVSKLGTSKQDGQNMLDQKARLEQGRKGEILAP